MPRTTQAKTWENRVRALSAIAGAMIVVQWCAGAFVSRDSWSEYLVYG